MRTENRVLVIKSVGQQPYVQLRHTYTNIIKTDLTATGYGNVGWIHLAQKWVQGQAVVNIVMNSVP